MNATSERMPHATQIPLKDMDAELSIPSLPVQGKLPDWVEGTLIRNGPAKFHFGSKTIPHWFDGLAMLHAFSFSNGKVSYRNRFLRSQAYLGAMQKGDLRFMGFAQDPCYTVFWRLFAHFFPSVTPDIIQNANVNIARVAGAYTALTETPLPVVFDPVTLQTIGPLNYKDSLERKDCFESAHPHYDPERKELVNFQISFGRKCLYTLYTVPDGEKAQRKPFFQMETDQAAYMHTFALTKRFAILVEFPLLLNPLDLLLKSGGFITHFKWEKSRPARFHLIDRAQGRLVRTYETEAFFCFHHINAFENGEEVVIDLVSYPDASIVFGEPPTGQMRKVERFRLALKGFSIQRETIADSLIELPRIHYAKYNCSPYRYVYGVGFKYPEKVTSSIPILKIDVENGSSREWGEEGALAGEPVFIPCPDASAEDDGILLSVVSSEKKNCSFLLVLEAKSLQEIARAEISTFIPYGLHGMFFKN